jgi:hypothetical protein
MIIWSRILDDKTHSNWSLGRKHISKKTKWTGNERPKQLVFVRSRMRFVKARSKSRRRSVESRQPSGKRRRRKLDSPRRGRSWKQPGNESGNFSGNSRLSMKIALMTKVQSISRPKTVLQPKASCFRPGPLRLRRPKSQPFHHRHKNQRLTNPRPRVRHLAAVERLLQSPKIPTSVSLASLSTVNPVHQRRHHRPPPKLRLFLLSLRFSRQTLFIDLLNSRKVQNQQVLHRWRYQVPWSESPVHVLKMMTGLLPGLIMTPRTMMTTTIEQVVEVPSILLVFCSVPWDLLDH